MGRIRTVLAAAIIAAAPLVAITSTAHAATGPGVVNQAQAAQAASGVVPAVTCGNYGHLVDYSYGSYQVRSHGSGQYVTLEAGNQTNWCIAYTIGCCYSELVQYGTNLCLTLDWNSQYQAGEAYGLQCRGLVSQYWDVDASAHLITLYNYTCGHNYNNIFNVEVSFGGSGNCDIWTFT